MKSKSKSMVWLVFIDSEYENKNCLSLQVLLKNPQTNETKKIFLQPLLEQRKKLKQEAKSAQEQEIKNNLNAQQNSLKLMINTLYGVICSIYFPVGNTVVADNITARARCEVWKVSKCLQLRQTITDGGFYQPEKVFQFKKKKENRRKPSFQALADPRNLIKHRSIDVVSLGKKDWKSMFEENPNLLIEQNIDELAEQHINEFWEHYGLKLKMKVEHKMENFS